MSTKKCSGPEKPYMFREYFGLFPFGELYMLGGYLSSPCHAAPQFAPFWAAALSPLHLRGPMYQGSRSFRCESPHVPRTYVWRAETTGEHAEDLRAGKYCPRGLAG